MKMFLTFFIFLFGYYFCLNITQENELIMINMTQNGSESFIFLIPPENSKSSVILTLDPISEYFDPGALDVFLSSEDLALNKSLYSKKCAIISFSSCSFDLANEKHEVDKIYFRIECMTEKCEYKLRVSHLKEILVHFNNLERFTFSRSRTELFNISVPAQDQFSRIVLWIKYQFIPSAENNFGEHYNIILSAGVPIEFKFGNQQFLVLNNNDSKLCFDCQISALIISPINSTIELEVFLYHKNENSLSINQFYVDYVFLGKDNEYFIEVQKELVEDPNYSLLIMFNSLSGERKNIYFDVDKYPRDKENYRWSSYSINSYYQENDIYFTKKNLELNKLQGYKYYILIEGYHSGIFSLFIKYNYLNLIPLYLGTMTSGLITNDEIINYEVKIWKSDDPNEIYTISATVETGHINIYGRICGILRQCTPISLEDIKNEYEIDFKANHEGVSSLTFHSDCKTIYCYYVFALVGNRLSSGNVSHYDLIFKKPNLYHNLIENVCHESQVNFRDYEQYKLYVEKSDDEIISVNFFLNTELQFIVGKEKICGNDALQSCIQKEGNFNNPISFEKEEFPSNFSLSGTYYILVFGIKSAEYIIFPEVLRKSQNKAFIKLLDGKPMRYFLSLSKKIAYFEFIINLESATNIEINIQSSEVNSLVIYLQNDDSIPNENNFLISSSENHLSFNHETFRETIYKIAVKSKFSLSAYKNNKIDFSIMFSTDNSLHHLEGNQPFYDNIRSKTIKHFLFYADLSNTNIFISRHIISPAESEFHLSMSFSMFLLDKKEATPIYITKDSTIKLDQKKLKSLCQSKYSELNKEKCPIYITLNNENEFDVSYILTLKTTEFAIKLIQGKQQIISINEDENYALLYFIPATLLENLEVYVYSLVFDFDIYISIYNNNETLPFSYWNYPSQNNYFTKGNRKKQFSTILPKEIWDKCWPNCTLLFKIIDDCKNLSSENFQEKLLHILVSSEIAEINENKPIKFKSEYHVLKFFIYDIKNIIKNKISIFIDLTNYMGTNEIYVILNEGAEADIFPSNEVYDFFSIDGHLTISYQDLISIREKNSQSKNISELNKGNLFIGTFCQNNFCESSINIRNSNYFIKKILHGQPYEFYISNHNNYEIYEYYHSIDKGFRIKINRELGNGTFSILSCFNSSAIDCKNQKENTSNLSIMNEAVVFKRTDQNIFCFNCFYLILIFPSLNSSNLKGTINIIHDDEFLLLADGHSFLDYVHEYGENKYMCHSSPNDELEVKITIYSNQPEVFISQSNSVSKNKFEFKGMKKIGENIITYLLNPLMRSNDKVFIIVYGATESKYSIKCQFKSSFTVLHAGLMEFSVLKPLTTHKYVFHAKEEEIYQNNPRLAIYYSKNISNGISINLFVKNATSEYGEHPLSTEIKMDPNESQIIYTYHSLIYNLLNKSQIYEIILQSSINEIISYSITIETNHINLLPFDSLMNMALNPSHLYYYETFLPSKGLLVVDLLECIGSVEIFTASTYENLLTNEFDQEFKSFSGQDNLRIFKVNKGKFYFALLSPNISIQENSKKRFDVPVNYIQVSTHFYESYMDIAQYRLMIGDNGLIDWHENSNGKITLIWSNVICKIECNEEFMDSIKIDYEILVSQNFDFLDSHGKCGIISFQDVKINTNEFFVKEINGNKLINMKEPLKYDIELDLKNNYYVTIIAKINGMEKETPSLLYYKEATIQKTEIYIQKVYSYGFVIVCLLIILVLGSCLCYFLGRYRKLKTLKYEVKEVENVSSISSLNTSIEMKTNKVYQGLVEQLN